MTILHQPQSLEIFGDFPTIGRFISFFIAFLPTIIYMSRRVPKVAVQLAAYYAIVFVVSHFPVIADSTNYSPETDLPDFMFFSSVPMIFVAMCISVYQCTGYDA